MVEVFKQIERLTQPLSGGILLRQQQEEAVPHKDPEERRAYKQKWKREQKAKIAAENPELALRLAEQERNRVNTLNADPERRARNAAWARDYRARNIEVVREKEKERAKRKAAKTGDRKAYAQAYYQANREKQIATAQRWRKDNPERSDAIAARNRPATKFPGYYPFVPGQACEACGDVLPTRKEAHADHCRAGSHFRGWLCRGCNFALGNLKDDAERIARLLAYLQRSMKRQAKEQN